MPQEITSAIGRLWQIVQRILPNLEELDFENHLDRRKDAEWYKTILNNVAQQKGKISSFGEDEGIKLLLSFVTLCLIAADTKKKKNEKGDLVKLSMSILLPIVSVCLIMQDEDFILMLLNCQYH